jgi:hypothetical protein
VSSIAGGARTQDILRATGFLLGRPAIQGLGRPRDNPYIGSVIAAFPIHAVGLRSPSARRPALIEARVGGQGRFYACLSLRASRGLV